MTELKFHIAVKTLNVNEFNSPIKDKILKLGHNLNTNS